MKLIVNHNPPIRVPAIAMEKSPNVVIFVVGRKQVNDTNHRAIQPCSIPTNRDLPDHKTDTATIRAITINGVNTPTRGALSSTSAGACQLHCPLYWGLGSWRIQMGVARKYVHCRRTRKQQERCDSSGWNVLFVFFQWWSMWVFLVLDLTQQPDGVIGSSTYGRVAREKEKCFMCSPWT